MQAESFAPVMENQRVKQRVKQSSTGKEIFPTKKRKIYLQF